MASLSYDLPGSSGKIEPLTGPQLPIRSILFTRLPIIGFIAISHKRFVGCAKEIIRLLGIGIVRSSRYRQHQLM
jgi:hypothetical protein